MRPRSPTRIHVTPSPLALITLTLAAVLGGCGDTDAPPRSVLLISIDTLRADRLGCTGHPKASTPNLDKIARAGAVYQNGVAPAPLTLPSHSTLLSGLLPIEHGVRDNRPFAFPADKETLATRFKSRGYATHGVVGAEPLALGCGLERGFDQYDADLPRSPRGTVRLAERPATLVTDAALKTMDEVDPDQPFFLFVHYFDVHDPYVPPEPFATKFAASPYDGEIAYVDQQIGRLIRSLRERRLVKPDTIIMVVSDHGESLGEHGEPTHGLFAYDATIRVPVLIRDAGGATGTIDDPVRLRDVHDFLLARASGIEHDLAAPGRRGEPALVESLYGALHCNYAQLRGIRTPGGQKYLEAGSEELFHLQQDPGEANDLASDSASAAELNAAREALTGMMSGLTLGDPGQQGDSLPGYLSSPGNGGAIPVPTRQENKIRPAPADKRDSYAAMQEGIRLYQIGLTEGALMQLEAAVAADEENPTAQFWLGQALKRSALDGLDPERMDLAAKAYLRSAALRSHDTRPRDMAIFCTYQLGRFEDAYEYGMEAIRDKTATAATYEVLAKLCLASSKETLVQASNPHRNEKKALEHFTTSFDLDPGRMDLQILEWLLPRYLARGDTVHAAAVRQRIAAEAPKTAPSGGGRP